MNYLLRGYLMPRKLRMMLPQVKRMLRLMLQKFKRIPRQMQMHNGILKPLRLIVFRRNGRKKPWLLSQLEKVLIKHPSVSGKNPWIHDS